MHERWNEWTRPRYGGANRYDRGKLVFQFLAAKAKVEQVFGIPIKP